MEYDELFTKALRGRSVNQAAKDWGVPQKTLDTFKKGRLPDYQTAMIIAREAQTDPGEVLAILARHEARKKPRSLFPDLGFAAAGLLVSVNLFLTPTPAEAAPVRHSKTSTVNNINYAKLRRQRMRKLQAVLTRLKRIFPRAALQATAP